MPDKAPVDESEEESAGSTAASLVLALLWRQVRLVGPYVRQHFFLRSYPRLQLQHAVFLN
jgi:hypothetical protein